MIGRYHRVRPIGPYGIGAPYVWDRGRAHEAPRMIPAPYDKGESHKGFTRYGEWWRSPEGIWTPAISGGSGGTYYKGGWEHPHNYLFSGRNFGSTQSTLALDSAYTYASAGDAMGHRVVLPVADTLATVYYHIAGFTGTAANVNDINLELRDNSATIGAGTTLHESKSHDPASTTGWRSSTGWTFSLSANTRYWVVVADADGNGTDYATMLLTHNFWGTNIAAEFTQHQAASVTAGFTVAPTFAGRPGAIVLVLGSGLIVGQPYATYSAPASSTNQRGLRFVAPAALKLYGMTQSAGVATTTLTGINLWSGSGGPSGSPDSAGTVFMPVNNVGTNTMGMSFETPPSLTQGTTYRLVYSFSAANNTIPPKLAIGTGSDATLRSAMPGAGAWYYTEANGTSDWSNDDTSTFPAVDVIVEDFVTATSGGGGGFAGVLGE